MDHKANPRPSADGAGVRTYDLTGKRVGTEYRLFQTKRKGPSLFDQLVALAHHTKAGLEFEHAYGPDRPSGRGWWSPVEDGPCHFVRSARRRRS